MVAINLSIKGLIKIYFSNPSLSRVTTPVLLNKKISAISEQLIISLKNRQSDYQRIILRARVLYPINKKCSYTWKSHLI